MTQTDIESVVKKFKTQSNPDDRYTSFDYCYNYFWTTNDPIEDIEKSCLVLGFYLASWGMFRGSSFLLQKSVKHFEPTIRYIATLDKSVWDIDVDNYDEKNIQTIIGIYKDKLSAETFTTDFMTGQKTTTNYPKAKIIDMYGFTVGQ